MALIRRTNRIRTTWEAAAETGLDIYVGRPESALQQLETLFSELGAQARGDGTCLEIGCGTGRMTEQIVGRWPKVLAVDVSPAMLARARERLQRFDHVELREVDGEHLDGIGDERAATVICFGVFQHLPAAALVGRMLSEIARVLAPNGEAFVQVPVLRPGARARAWRLVRTVGTRVQTRRRPSDPGAAPEYRGVRLTRRKLDHAIRAAGLVVVENVVSKDTTLYSSYTHADDLRLRLRRR